jgi:hypothetical protein
MNVTYIIAICIVIIIIIISIYTSNFIIIPFGVVILGLLGVAYHIHNKKSGMAEQNRIQSRGARTHSIPRRADPFNPAARGPIQSRGARTHSIPRRADPFTI